MSSAGLETLELLFQYPKRQNFSHPATHKNNHNSTDAPVPSTLKASYSPLRTEEEEAPGALGLLRLKPPLAPLGVPVAAAAVAVAAVLLVVLRLLGRPEEDDAASPALPVIALLRGENNFIVESCGGLPGVVGAASPEVLIMQQSRTSLCAALLRLPASKCLGGERKKLQKKRG